MCKPSAYIQYFYPPPSDDAENRNAAKLLKDSKDRFGGGSSRSVSSRGAALLCEDKKLRLAITAP